MYYLLSYCFLQAPCSSMQCVLWLCKIYSVWSFVALDLMLRYGITPVIACRILNSRKEGERGREREHRFFLVVCDLQTENEKVWFALDFSCYRMLMMATRASLNPHCRQFYHPLCPSHCPLLLPNTWESFSCPWSSSPWLAAPLPHRAKQESVLRNTSKACNWLVHTHNF